MWFKIISFIYFFKDFEFYEDISYEIFCIYILLLVFKIVFGL